MKYNRIFFLILITLNITLGQDLIDLYDDILSDKIMKNPVYKMQINSKLESNAKLNPQFIYYVLENAIYYFDYGIRNTEENYAQDLAIQSYKMKEKINIWRSLQHANVDKYIKNKFHQHKINYYLNQLVHGTTVEFSPFDITLGPPVDTTTSPTLKVKSELSKLKVDQNKMNFYMLRYFSAENIANYNNQTDYLSQLTNELEKQIDFFNDKYARASSLSYDERDQITEKALEYPYIFKDTYIENFPKTTNFQLYEFIEEMTSDEVFVQYTLGIQLLSSFDFLNTISGRFNYVQSFVHINDKVSVKMQNGVYFGVSYSLPLKEKVTTFSNLKIDAGFAITNFISASTHIQEYKDQLLYDPKTNTSFVGSFDVQEGNHELTSFFIRFYSPFYYFTDKFYFEAGLGYFYNDITVNYEIDYDVRSNTGYPDKDIITYTDQQHIPGIVFNMNWYLTRNLLFRFDSFIPMQHIICLEYIYIF